MKFVNLGVLAHVDAGKTSLTERLLFDAGVIEHIGRVDSGNTQTDSLDLERQRGITIQSGVVAFRIGDLQVNLIDTPGHSDFVAEVERALRVLDGAVLVISAVEGIQARTRILMRSLAKLKIPTLIFANKIDRTGARYEDLVNDIRTELTPQVVPLTRVVNVGHRDAGVDTFDDIEAIETMTGVLTLNSEGLLTDYVNGSLTRARCESELARQTQIASVHPICFGSAVTGEGVPQLTEAIARLLKPQTVNASELRATVFKIERGRNNEKIAYVRVWSGTVRQRDLVRICSRSNDGKIVASDGRVTAVQVFEHGVEMGDRSATPGSIAKLTGLHDIRVGDQLGSADFTADAALFAPPTLRTVVEPTDPLRRIELLYGLQQLSDVDPLVRAEYDSDGEVCLNLYGEVQKEVIADTLKSSFGVEVQFKQSSTIYIERVAGIGEAFQAFDMKGPNFFWATIGLRIEPAPEGTGVNYDIGTLRGMLPLSFHKAVEEGIRETLRQGPHGWQVPDCTVTLTQARFQPPVSVANHFRDLASLLTAEAISQAKTEVCEPIHGFQAVVPNNSMNDVLVLLRTNRASIAEQVVEVSRCSLSGTIPASNIHDIFQRLLELTNGEGTFEADFHSYQMVTRKPPKRSHAGANPYDRNQYMLHVLRTV